MKAERRVFLFWPGVVIGLLILCPAVAENSGPAHLSRMQAVRVARDIGKLKRPEERALASGWSDAKKAAEFICRPLATTVLRRRIKGADRIVLGTDDPATLHLVTDQRLEGSGQVRTGSSWTFFRFACALDARTGRALSFVITPTGKAGSESGSR